ncbi:glycosyl transferase family 8, partial [Streptococcus agalactiae]|nr:glycosyl transferase family 8 [Streptococcus agalactiae]
DDTFKEFKTPRAHITYMAYARYYIPQLIDAEKVLYLDIDTLVVDNLDKLFEIELGDYPIAAILDGDGIHFNSGVMLINSLYWMRYRVTEKLLEITERELDNGIFGDQGVLNLLFDNNW